VILLFITRHLGFYGNENKVAANGCTSDGEDKVHTKLWSCGKQGFGRTMEVTDESVRNK
jgi:hypothetical protein